MEVVLQRLENHPLCTPGYLTIDGKAAGCMLEDPFQDNGDEIERGNERVEAGRYEIKQRKVLSPMTERYRKKYPWFGKQGWHLEITGIPNRKYVYIHLGNDHRHTKGCTLNGTYLYPNNMYGWKLAASTDKFKETFKTITDALEKGERVFIEIIDPK
jgi:hypothetical protein